MRPNCAEEPAALDCRNEPVDQSSSRRESLRLQAPTVSLASPPQSATRQLHCRRAGHSSPPGRTRWDWLDRHSNRYGIGQLFRGDHASQRARHHDVGLQPDQLLNQWWDAAHIAVGIADLAPVIAAFDVDKLTYP